jgi:hypothetical protein
MTQVDNNLKVEIRGEGEEKELTLRSHLHDFIDTTARGHEKVVDANWINIHEDEEYIWTLKMILVKKKAKKR